MKTISLLLIPSAALILTSCAGPGGPGYAGPGPGPGYYGHDTVYVQGSDHQDRDYNNDQDHRNVTDVNEVNVNRTTENDRTVNKTNVNTSNVKRTNVASTDLKKKAVHKPVAKKDDNQQANPPS